MNVGRYLRGEDRHVGTARTTQPQPPQRTEQEPDDSDHDRVRADFDYAMGYSSGITEGYGAGKAYAEAQRTEQEPVGDEWTPCMKLPVVVYVRKQRLGESHVSTREGITPVKPDDLIMRGVLGEEYPIGRTIFEQTYTLDITPPQRTWVDLTDEEIDNINYTSAHMLAREVLAKLKEKNT